MMQAVRRRLLGVLGLDPQAEERLSRQLSEISDHLRRVEERVEALRALPEPRPAGPAQESGSDSAAALSLIYNRIMELRELVLDVEARVAQLPGRSED